jgi:hypothetical protein
MICGVMPLRHYSYSVSDKNLSQDSYREDLFLEHQNLSWGSIWSSIVFLWLHFSNFIFNIFFLFLLLCWMGIHCSIDKSSYSVLNISYVNSSPPSISFILPSLHFSVYTLLYTVLHHIHLPMPLPHLPHLPTATNRTCFLIL